MATADPSDLADALARWSSGSLVASPASPTVVGDVRRRLEGVAREAVARAGAADLASNPIRLSKGRLSDLLACERHLVEKGDERPAGGPGDEALHLGVLIDLLAEHHVVAGRKELAPEPLALGLELCVASGDDKAATVAWVAQLEGEARRSFEARLLEKQAGLLGSWPAFDPRWWARTQERASVGLADGDVVLSGRADVTVGGPPTPWPILVVEVKSGTFTIEQRDDGLIYALLLALRDERAPAAAVTVTAGGAVHVEAATAERLHTAAERLGVAILAAGELAGGRPPVERAGFRCDRCPALARCATGAGRERERQLARIDDRARPMTLHDDLVDALAPVADQLAEHQPGTKPAADDWLDVRSGSVAAALRCPAAMALDGDDGFEPSAATAGWKATVDATDLLVHGHHDPRRGAPPGDPASAFRQLWADRARLDSWPWPWLADEAQPADRALTAAEVHRRAAGLARMLDPWPPPDAGAVGHRSSWTFPRRALRLHGRAELVLGRRGRGHTLVVVLNGDHGPSTRTRLAYEAVVETAALRAAPATVLGVLPDAGRRWALGVDDGLLTDGVRAAALAAAATLGARTREAARLARTPGPGCRHCAHQGTCEPGTTWLTGPGLLRSGFLPPPAELPRGLPSD